MIPRESLCVRVSEKEMPLQRMCILFVCVRVHALAKSITHTPPTSSDTFTMQATSCRSLATVLAGLSTVGTTLKPTRTRSHRHTHKEEEDRE